MPEVLVFIDWFYPGFKAGGPIRSCLNLVLHLQHDFQFYIVTRNTDYCDPEPYPNLKQNEWLDGPGTSKVMYLSEDHSNANFYTALITEKNWHAVYLNSLWSPSFTLLPLRLLKKLYKGKVIVAPRGMLAPDAMGLKRKKKIAFLYFSRLAGWYKQAIFQATSEHEKTHIQEWFPHNKIQFAPALPPYHENKEPLLKTKEKGVLNILTVARVAQEKNILEACRLVGLMGGVVNFTLVGPVYDEVYWAQCKAITAAYSNHIYFEYKGAMSNDAIIELMQTQHVTLLPTLGENFGHTILESFLNAMPVVISDRTPWKNLSMNNGGYAIPLNKPQQFLDALNTYQMMDAAEFREASHGAFEFAQNYLQSSEAIALNKSLFK
jgi:glycosyltransferase involved in cell wall biosynthesis